MKRILFLISICGFDRRPGSDCLRYRIVSEFRKLRLLEIDAPLNGRYPRLFNFPLLHTSWKSTSSAGSLKLDLEMLAGLPLLKDFSIAYDLHDEVSQHLVTGSMNILRVLKDTLTNGKIKKCLFVKGNFMDLEFREVIRMAI